MAMTKQAALQGLRDSHRQLMSRLEVLAPDAWTAPLSTGSWRVRDVAAHIAAWDRLLVDDLGALLHGQPPEWLSWDDATTDAVNETHVRESAAWAIDRLRVELRENRAALLDAVAALDDEQFARSQRASDIDVSPAWLCEYWITHDREHTAQLPRVREAG